MTQYNSLNVKCSNSQHNRSIVFGKLLTKKKSKVKYQNKPNRNRSKFNGVYLRNN